jgi:hypothetical protein
MGIEPRRRRGRLVPRQPGDSWSWPAGSCGITTARALAAEAGMTPLANPVHGPQLLGHGRILAVPAAGQPGGGPLAGLAVGRQPASAPAVELTGQPDSAAAGATLARAHAAAPPDRLPRRALAEARARRVK